MPAEDAAALRELQEERGGSLLLRFSKGVDRDLPVTLESVGPRENGRVVAVFRGNAFLRELTLLRQQRAQIVTGSITGIRVPSTAGSSPGAGLTSTKLSPLWTTSTGLNRASRPTRQ